MKKENKVLTFEQYQNKYTKEAKYKHTKGLIALFAFIIGLILAICLVLFTLRMFEKSKYYGWGSLGVSVLVFLFGYIVPLIRIASKKQFETNVSLRNARKAQRHNQKLRNILADNIIDIYNSVKEKSMYTDTLVYKLELARKHKNNKLVKELLNQIYSTDIKTKANKYIRSNALKAGVATAVSQSSLVDTVSVGVIDIKLIKDLVFLYGFRPNDEELLRIYKHVVANAVLTLGLGHVSASLATAAVTKMGTSLPFVGKLIDSATQGLVNSLLTALIGLETKKYLMREYKLQDILDNIDMDSEDEKLLAEVKDEVAKNIKKNKSKEEEKEASK